MSDIKQVKIDNWGIFFLQRLQQFFNRTDFCDLTLQFENNVQLKVHRLVMNACTEYFQILENTCDVVDDCLIMPLDLQPDVVVPIVNFMYTGQLEFQMSHYDKLYAAAKLMNLTVLTKLLDAQKVPVSPLAKPLHKRASVGAVTWNLQGKKIVPKTMDPDLPEPLPGRKLPVWKRKTIPTSSFRASTSDFISENIVSSFKSTSTPTPKVLDNTPRPTRFEWPEDEIPSTDLMVSSFDDISYGSQPLAAPIIKSNSMSNSSAAFEEIKKNTIKRPATSYNHHNNPVNLQEVKEYLQEQKLRNDYILRNEERNSASQNEDSNDNIEYRDENSSQGGESIFGNIKEENPNKSILKPSSNDEDHSPAKKVRFSLEGKENATKGKKSIIEAKVKVESGDLTNHTKIISEVLKKYPYLMQKNKNIKLKIMQKNQSSNETMLEQPKKIKIIKSNEKIVEEKQSPQQEKQLQGNNSSQDESGIEEYKCKDCNIPNEYIQLQSYPEYHDHIVEFHPERIDARVCEHCGHRSTRRHLLLYHQLTKHGIDPPPPFVFPQCDRCDYVAVNKVLLKRHQAGVHGSTQSYVDEKASRIVCQICNATFKRNLLFIKHCHQTGHNEDLNFDCEYCHKKFLRASYVIAHMKSYHKPELESENINLDELDKESIKSEIKIISNISVNTNIEEIENKTEDMVPTPSVPSSEAEALVNVASGIAASLGLVVLDENQFVIQTQDDCTTEEYILPEISEEDGTLVHQTPQTIALTVSDQQTANNIVTTSTPVTTTDELVMVLTDHDYSDGNTPIITSENSNIVVLYSHPVEGQSTQYISPEGNIVLNSQTGVIEMNGHKLQVTNAEQLEIKNTENEDVEKPVEIQQEVIEPEESIEMIQQEINNHFQETEKLNQEIIQHSNAVAEILSTEIQSQSSENVPEETSDDLARTLEDKDGDVHTEEQNEIITEHIEEPKEPEALPVSNENLEPEPMEVDEEIDEVAKAVSPKTDNETNNKDVESISEELEPPALERPSEIDASTSEIEIPTLTLEPSAPAVEPLAENQSVTESDTHLEDEAMDVDEADNSSKKEDSPESEDIEQPNEETIKDTENVQIAENTEINEDTNVTEHKTEHMEPPLVKDVENDSDEKVNDETITEANETDETNEVVQTSEIKEDEVKAEETQDKNEKTPEIVEEDNSNKNASNETKEPEEKTEDVLPIEEKNENETINETPTATKDNVTSLVSDWCDDDSGLQGNSTELVQQSIETNETEPSESNQFVIPATEEQNNDKETNKEENDENKVSNIKITKLLDDWDDGDTDSQNSGETTQQVTKNPINNLIEDWDDE
ncbi:centrosome-associated zinc finger protein CP190 [Chrysoperla carnea]|uniref:centrosome-associated zinc finger protein CP190 n=1 Tax=Chrysoperla carnea TaxID=189513 RepID=UPI001D075194|nr:centrosome-associated zinc finger protein CP190 [Chrysoperla carnea]